MKFVDEANIEVRAGDGGTAVSVSGVRSTSPLAGLTVAMVAMAAVFTCRPTAV